MSSHFIYSAKLSDGTKQVSYSVFFFPIHQAPLTDLDEDIKNYFTNFSPTDISLFIFPEYQESELVKVTEEKQAPIQRLLNFSYDKRIHLVSYDENGVLKEITYNDGPPKLKTSIVNKLKQEGLQNIFFNRNGLLEGDETFHYILPSKSHSRTFIRVGNILTCSNEVNFMAVCLLPYFRRNPRNVYCDSASISPIVYATTLLRTKICHEKNNNSVIVPLIESFGGYEGLKDYKFQKDDCLFIISTSTSGNLKKDLIKKQIDEESIITLYYNGDSKGDKNIMTNLQSSSHPLLKNSNGKFKTYPNELECEFCNKNSIPVKLSGDQFLPAKPYLEQILVKKEHRPKWLNEFMYEFHGREIIKCHFGSDIKKVREFYLDLEKVHETLDVNFEHDDIKVKFKRKPNYQTKFYKYLENNLPVTIVYIIHLPDKASSQMATQIKDYLIKKGSSDIEIINFRHFINGEKAIDPKKGGTVLIVSSSIATGKKLYQLSLKFRDYDNLSVSYFFGICRTPTEDVLKTLTSDLVFRKDLINDNKLDYLQNIHIPDRHTDFGKDLENSPWAQERRFITETLRPIFVNKSFDVAYLDERIDNINDAEVNLGMSHKLFWRSAIDKNELELRKSFAFFDFDYYTPEGKSKASQSDVYFTISAILHNLRNNFESDGKRLFQHEHRRSLISPQTFSRYSDGIIQACYLRGSQPGELNYSIDYNVSYNMKRTMLNIFEDSKSSDAEALYEFLYAMAVGKLKLIRRDTLDLVGVIEKKYKNDQIAVAFCAVIKSL